MIQPAIQHPRVHKPPYQIAQKCFVEPHARHPPHIHPLASTTVSTKDDTKPTRRLTSSPLSYARKTSSAVTVPRNTFLLSLATAITSCMVASRALSRLVAIRTRISLYCTVCAIWLAHFCLAYRLSSQLTQTSSGMKAPHSQLAVTR